MKGADERRIGVNIRIIHNAFVCKCAHASNEALQHAHAADCGLGGRSGKVQDRSTSDVVVIVAQMACAK